MRHLAWTLALAALAPVAVGSEPPLPIRLHVDQEIDLVDPAIPSLIKELRKRTGLVLVDEAAQAEVRVSVLAAGKTGERRVVVTSKRPPGTQLGPRPATGADTEVVDTRRYVLLVRVSAGDEIEELLDVPRSASLRGAAKVVAREIDAWVRKRRAALLTSRAAASGP